MARIEPPSHFVQKPHENGVEPVRPRPVKRFDQIEKNRVEEEVFTSFTRSDSLIRPPNLNPLFSTQIEQYAKVSEKGRETAPFAFATVTRFVSKIEELATAQKELSSDYSRLMGRLICIVDSDIQEAESTIQMGGLWETSEALESAVVTKFEAAAKAGDTLVLKDGNLNFGIVSDLVKYLCKEQRYQPFTIDSIGERLHTLKEGEVHSWTRLVRNEKEVNETIIKKVLALQESDTISDEARTFFKELRTILADANQQQSTLQERYRASQAMQYV